MSVRFIVALAIAMGAVTSPAAGRALKEAMYLCIAEAMLRDQRVEQLGDPASGKLTTAPNLYLVCEDRTAEPLFRAMEMLAEQTVASGIVTRRVSTGVTCSRFPNGGHHCTILINTSERFQKAFD